ncbi:MAG TPA: hypothetical protein VN818_02715 [Gammaproteobacteria bacterium]|nr:hypothetical protein [Gammaproteobacteria bacterium]
MNDQLSMQRLAFVLRSDLMRVYRSAFLISGTAALVALVVSVIGAYDGEVGDGVTFYRAFFIATLFAWGTIATSVCFNDLHGRGTNTAFLLLPASALEKTLSRLLLYTAGMIAYLQLLTMFLSWVLEGINTLWIGEHRAFFSPLDGVGWSLVPHFLVAQALFFLGAAWFRKVQFVKTVASVIGICIGLCLIAVSLAWVVGPERCLNANCFEFPFLDWLTDAAPVAYFFLLPPFCWFVAWLRVTETQVSHGI